VSRGDISLFQRASDVELFETGEDAAIAFHAAEKALGCRGAYGKL
jgi:hypothetical protein